MRSRYEMELGNILTNKDINGKQNWVINFNTTYIYIYKVAI